MSTGLVALLASIAGVLIAVASVGLIWLLRVGIARWTPSHRPDSELRKAHDEIQRQIEAGRDAWPR